MVGGRDQERRRDSAKAGAVGELGIASVREREGGPEGAAPKRTRNRVVALSARRYIVDALSFGFEAREYALCARP